METHSVIPTYIINLKHRTDRREHIIREFANRPEFLVEFVDACEHTVGAMGLWQSICKIISSAEKECKEFVLIAEDDHQFTSEYNHTYLSDCIAECISENGDVLLGATSWFDSALPVSDKLHWVGRFTGTQFMIIFRKFYRSILEAPFKEGDNADFKIGSLTMDKFFMSHPISTQVYFGYSDITVRNSLEGRLEDLFNNSTKGIEILNTVSNHFNDLKCKSGVVPETDITNLILPVYIILPATADKASIVSQFSGKQEFEINFVEVDDPEMGDNVNRWNAIRRVIELAKRNDDDVIIICDKDHLFTASYSKEYLFNHIIEAHYQGADILLAGCEKCHRPFPVAPFRYWIAEGSSDAFLVIYSKFFETILAEPFDEEVKPAELINEMTFHKMILYPFVSTVKEREPVFSTVVSKMAEVEIASARYYWKAAESC